MNVFLGGTCNGSRWRNEMMVYLDKEKVSYFNPVVDNWNEEAQKREIEERENCDFCLYCITPKMTGVYSIAEVVDDSNKRPEKTILVVINDYDGAEFDAHQQKSLEMVMKMVKNNGGLSFIDLKMASVYIGKMCKNEK